MAALAGPEPWTRLAYAVLVVATLGFTSLNLERLANFHLFEWDLSIFSQGLWLLSRGEAPFVTIRGLHLLGDHSSYSLLLLVPVFRVWPGPGWLILCNSAALAATGVLIHRFARDRLGPASACVVLISYLLHPALQYTWLELFSLGALALPPLVAAFVAVRQGRASAAVSWSVLALAAKENVAVTVFALGVYAALRGSRRLGLTLSIGSVIYLMVLMGVVFPFFNASGYEYSGRLYGDFADSVASAIVHLANPFHLWRVVAVPENGAYLLQLLGPLAFVPLLAPGTLLVAAQLPLNLISSWPYAHEIRYHYVALVIPFLALALVDGLGRLKGTSRRLATAIVALASLSGFALLAPGWVSPRQWGVAGAKLTQHRIERPGVDRLLQQIPADASVAASTRFLPHLCLRRRLFLLPNLGGSQELPDYVISDFPMHPENERLRCLILAERLRVVGVGGRVVLLAPAKRETGAGSACP